MIVFFVVYSGLMLFFLMPFGAVQQQTFAQVVRQTLFHKKAILALLLLAFVLFSIWSTYEGIEWQVNEHSVIRQFRRMYRLFMRC